MAAEVWPASLPVVLPYTTAERTAAALHALQPLVAGLDAEVMLLAVQVVPYPLPVNHPDVDAGRLGEDLHRLASASEVPVRVQIVLARERDSALQLAIPPRSLVVVPTRPRRWWRTAERQMAAALRRNGHNVTLLSLEGEA